MPSDSDSHYDVDRDRERERDRDIDRTDRGDRGASKQKNSASSKTKDLSHVPCKFYKVGGCTAGASCPFSHMSAEPGAQKETCTWFIKGNCKFGHKCALAHVLPGQSMAMDRKNKKAAQTAAQAAAAAGGAGDKNNNKQSTATAAGGRSSSKRDHTASSGSSANRLPLLAGGATAPTRLVNSTSGSSSTGRPPMGVPLKATISPSAPAPLLQDIDFASSFAPLEEMEGVLQQQSSSSLTKKDQQQEDEEEDDSKHPSSYAEAASGSHHHHQSSTATNAITPTSASRSSANNTTTNNDFGPIGSPPGYRSGQPISPSRVNGGTFSPGTSPRAHSHLNGVNLSSSPSANNNAGILSSSPFSAPGTQSVFLSSSFSTGGVAASLGSGLAMMGGRRGWGDSETTSHNIGSNSFSGLLSGQLSSSVSHSHINGLGARGEYDISIESDELAAVRNARRIGIGKGVSEVAVDDEDLDLIPSSLNDLLTPEERSRRMSRSNSGQQAAGGISQLSNALANVSMAAATDNVTVSNGTGNGTGFGATGMGAPNNGTSGLGHRYSRSVPAPSLLGDMKSIWSDNTSTAALPSSPPTHRGTPSASYTSSRFDPYGEEGLSMSIGSGGTSSSLNMMSPSNASAAFLPGLHHHYLSAKAKQAQAQTQAQLGLGGIGRQMRGASNPLYAGATGSGASGAPNNSLASNYLQPLGGSGLGLPASASTSSGLHTHIHGNTTTTYRTTPSPFDLTQTLHQQQQQTRPIPSGLSAQKSNNEDTIGPLLSPSARALQQHAPGQSLPQGLAAGYSRIHALPPVTNIASPPTSGSFVPGTSPSAHNAFASENIYGDWASLGSQQQQQQQQQSSAGNPGLESMFSRLGYGGLTNSRIGTGTTPAPPGLTRNISGGRYPQQQQQQSGPLSPLSKPVARDDDDLFQMDDQDK